MMHAKTAVADSRWARVGSSNLNIASWMGNCELDVAVENVAFAKSMETQYLRDLENATEIVLSPRRRVQRCDTKPQSRRAGGSSGRAAASALRLAHSMGSALGNRRVLGQGEMTSLPWIAGFLLVVAIAAIIWPRLLAWPLALLAAWWGVAMWVRYFSLAQDRRGQYEAGNSGRGRAGDARIQGSPLTATGCRTVSVHSWRRPESAVLEYASGRPKGFVKEDRTMNIARYGTVALSLLLAFAVIGAAGADIKPSAADNDAHATAIKKAIDSLGSVKDAVAQYRLHHDAFPASNAEAGYCRQRLSPPRHSSASRSAAMV